VYITCLLKNWTMDTGWINWFCSNFAYPLLPHKWWGARPPQIFFPRTATVEKVCRSNIPSRYTAVRREVDDWQITDAVVRWRRRLTDCARTADRYWRGWSWTQPNIMTPSLNTTRTGTSSQCSSEWRSRDKPRSNLLVPVTTMAAAFNTPHCSLSLSAQIPRQRRDDTNTCTNVVAGSASSELG